MHKWKLCQSTLIEFVFQFCHTHLGLPTFFIVCLIWCFFSIILSSAFICSYSCGLTACIWPWAASSMDSRLTGSLLFLQINWLTDWLIADNYRAGLLTPAIIMILFTQGISYLPHTSYLPHNKVHLTYEDYTANYTNLPGTSIKFPVFPDSSRSRRKMYLYNCTSLRTGDVKYFNWRDRCTIVEVHLYTSRKQPSWWYSLHLRYICNRAVQRLKFLIAINLMKKN